MARDDELVQDPEELEEERRRRAAIGVGATNPPSVIPQTRDLDALNAPVPDITGIRPLTSAASISPMTTERPARPTAPAGSIQDTQNRLSQLQWERENPWGSPENHPGALGKIGHVLGKIGNIAGEAVAPNLMADIPGTDLHRQLEEQRLTRQLGEQEERASQAGLRNVQEQNLQSEIDARRNPKPKLLTGEENIAVGPDGKRYQRYELGDQSTAWAEEGTVPAVQTPAGIRPIATAATTPEGGIPPIARTTAPGLPAGAVIGKPKAVTAEDVKEKFLKLSSKPEAERTDDEKAFYNTHAAEFENSLPIGADRAKTVNAQIAQTLKSSKIDPSTYQVNEKSTPADMKAQVTAAQKVAAEDRAQKSAERIAGAPEAAQARKDARTMGYAIDKDGHLSYMSRADADKLHSTFEEQKSGDVNKDRQAIRQLNDVQKNTSSYTKAAQAYQEVPELVRAKDQPLLHDLLNKAGISDLKLTGAVEAQIPIISAFTEALSRESKSAAYEALSKEGKDLFDGYLRTMSAIPAYQKALTGIGRTNKEMLDLELNNIANPSLDAPSILRKQATFQENLDRATEGFPNNLPGLKTPRMVRDEVEGKGGGNKILTYNPQTGKLE